MAATNFNTENRTYRQLLGNGLIYRVPPFQRDYSWDEEQWEELWTDIVGTLPPDGEPAHYMGYLVLQTSNNRTFEVIDGQQRLTTLSLIVLASMRLLNRFASEGDNAEANRMRVEQLRATYIGYLDPVTLTPHNKLELNRYNDPYYRDYLVTLRDRLPGRGFSASTLLMRRSFEWFEARLGHHVKDQPDRGKALAQLVDTMSDKLFFTVITVSDELNAYKVFETLNARGVRLSATDLLKNYLFSILARTSQADYELKELERRWDSMVGRLGQESFPDFLRMHWNSRHDFARQSELFKSIRGHIQSPKEAFDLLREMDEDIDTYLALTQVEGSDWPGPWKALAGELRMFSVRQPYPMLMAARRRLSDSDFEGLLRATVVLAFRYNVIGGHHTGEQERTYNTAAIKLHRGEVKGLREVLEVLGPIYPSDRAFKADFAEKSMKTTQSRNAKIVRYILANLERQSGGVEADTDALLYTIEHVLPQSPEAGWDDFSGLDLDNFVYRLGNMVMLEATKNREIQNKPYTDKKAVLLTSQFKLTRELAEENDEWTPERILARQEKLARMATTVWRIAQLGV